MQPQPPFKVIKVSRIDLDEIESLRECVEAYLDEYDEEATWTDVFRHIELKLDQLVLFVYLGNKISGFLVGYVLSSQYGKAYGFCDYIYVKPELRRTGAAKEMAWMGTDWIKSMGVEKIYFSTKRNSKAFMRFLGKGWKKDCEVLSLCVQ